MSAALTTLVDFLGAHPTLAVVIVFLISAGEALFIVGLFVPSTIVLVGAGALIGSGALSFWPIFLSTALGAVAGDAISYWIGHIYRDRIRSLWPFSRYVFLIEAGQAFFNRHGAKSIFIGRFIPAVKSIVPGIAGMVGMNVATFTTINVISAFAWAAAHLLPGIGIGKGLSRYWQANPRLVVLLLLTLLAVLVLWYMARLVLVLGIPALERLRQSSIQALEGRRGQLVPIARNFLRNESGIAVSLAWSLAGAAFTVGFVALLLRMLFDPELSAADHAVSTFIQSLRNEPTDAVMIAITMAGDSIILFVVASILVVWLIAYRQWKIGTCITIAILSAAIFVPVIKSILQRPRPSLLYSGAESFSFPSGHATLSATIFGITAVVLMHDAGSRARISAYSTVLVAIALIAVSRIYLGAHWPSDVLGGMAFGLSVVAAVAFFLHRRPLNINALRLAIVMAAGFVIAFGAHYRSSIDAWTQAYAYRPQFRTLALDDWLGGGWKQLPAARVTFDGEDGTPFILQAAVPVDELRDRLAGVGWIPDSTSAARRLTDAVIPSALALDARATLLRYHDGLRPELSLTRPAGADRESRVVLRFWDTGARINADAASAGATAAPILLGALSKERLDPVLFGFHETEELPLDKSSELSRFKDELAAQLAAAGFAVSGATDTLMLTYRLKP